MKKTILFLLLCLFMQGLYAGTPINVLEKPQKKSKKVLRTQKRQAKKQVRFKKRVDKLRRIINKKQAKLNGDTLTILLYFGLVITSIVLIIVATGVWQTIGIIALSVLALLFLFALFIRLNALYI